ncbi:MAG: DUF5104 domain-containing protein [Bacteroidaceae bacterium]|nr:DUF5104 domain-containing protein [Bacteroidaceae bacterium]
MADDRCEEIINSLNNKDSEALKNMFSPNALKGASDIDDGIKYLMEFYQGKMISKDGAVITSGSKNYAAITSELECNYEVETDSDSYVIYFIDVLTDTGNPDNVGLICLK